MLGESTLVDLTAADTKRFPPPDWVLPSFIEAASGNGKTYTPYRGDPGVREKVAANLTTFMGLSVDPATELVLTPGTQGGLFNVLLALVNAGDRVALFDPDYLSTGPILKRLGAVINPISFTWRAASPEVDTEALERAARGGARLLVFSNPNNPTGAIFSKATIHRIAEVAGRFDLMVLVDALYSRLRYDALPYVHLASLPGMRDRCITLLGPSKTESMSGYRVGVLIAPERVANRVEEMQALTVLRAPAYAQHTLVRWLRDDHEFVRQRVADYQELRDAAFDCLKSSPYLDPYHPHGTAYMLVALKNVAASDRVVAERLSDSGITVNPGSDFGERANGHFRICFAQDKRDLLEALERVKQIVSAFAERRA